MEDLLISQLEETTVKDFKKCFDDNGSSKNEENIKWQFLNNTEKKSAALIAKNKISGKVAGIYAMAFVKFRMGDAIVLGSQSMDTMIDHDYRGSGLFFELANEAYKRAKGEVDLVYGFPNKHSFKGFKKLLKWHVLDPLPFLIKPLRTKYFTSRIKYLKFLPDISLSPFSYRKDKRYRIEESAVFPNDVNLVWAKFSESFSVSVNRDKEYLDWRFNQKPNENYKIAHCYLDETYQGFIIYTVKGKHGGKIGYIMDLIYDPQEEQAASTLLNYAINHIKKEKADCILNWCLEHSPNYKVYKRKRFFDLPEKFRPIELHFGARPFNLKYEHLIKNRSNWYLSYADSDTV